jgi:hypothetical protein
MYAWPMNIAIMSSAKMPCTMCAICMLERVVARPGTRWSSTKPETITATPRKSRPPQKTIFSPALKRCDGGCSPPSMPPALSSHFTSSLLGRLLAR